MDNNNLYCTVHFTYSEPVFPGFKKVYEKFFMKLRDEAVDLLNPHYEEWNAEYDKEISGPDDLEYNTFIANKQREYLQIVNKKHEKDISPLHLYLDSGEDADIMGKIPWAGNEIEMHMSIKLLNEKEYLENLRASCQ